MRHRHHPGGSALEWHSSLYLQRASSLRTRAVTGLIPFTVGAPGFNRFYETATARLFSPALTMCYMI